MSVHPALFPLWVTWGCDYIFPDQPRLKCPRTEWNPQNPKPEGLGTKQWEPPQNPTWVGDSKDLPVGGCVRPLCFPGGVLGAAGERNPRNNWGCISYLVEGSIQVKINPKKTNKCDIFCTLVWEFRFIARTMDSDGQKAQKGSYTSVPHWKRAAVSFANNWYSLEKAQFWLLWWSSQKN